MGKKKLRSVRKWPFLTALAAGLVAVATTMFVKSHNGHQAAAEAEPA
jgi:hypothetical protein